MLVAMQAMQQELAILRQAIPVAPAGAAQGAGGGGVPGGSVPAGAAPGGKAEVPLLVSGLSLMQWMGMKLDAFDGSGTPVEVADWLTYVEDKMNVFEIVYGDRVCFGTQLLKGEAQIWWRGMQAAHSSSPGVLTWHVFIRKFERRFYPVTFLEKMKIDLQSFKQEKKSVTEYEVGFNKMVRFVPHVAFNEMEKASQFLQGLKPSIRHALGAFPLVDFRTTVEQALGVEIKHQYTMESQKSSGVDQPRGQDARRGNTGGPAHKRGKSQHQRHILTVANLLTRVLRGEVLRGFRLFLSPGWGWCVSVVVMLIAVQSASGVAGVLSAVRTTRMWCVGGILMGSSDGSR
jgi:hypothetical protein